MESCLVCLEERLGEAGSIGQQLVHMAKVVVT